MLVIPATYLAARARYSVGAALAATALVTTTAPLIIYSVNARGYTLLCLAFLLSIAIGAYALRTGNVVAWAAYVVVNVMGFFAIPIMLYPFGATTLWLAVSARRSRDLVAIALAGMGTLLLTADCYAGVIYDVQSLVGAERELPGIALWNSCILGRYTRTGPSPNGGTLPS